MSRNFSWALRCRPRCRARRFRSRQKHPQAGEVDRFPGAAGGVGAGIEEQHQFLAGEIGQRNAVAAVAGQAEGRGLGAFDQTGGSAAAGFAAAPIAGFYLTFSSGLCDALAKAVLAALRSFANQSPLRRTFAALLAAGAGVLADAFEPLRWAACGGFLFGRLLAAAGFRRAFCGLRGGLEDFLRDFLDIRLPFVAFGGSIIRVLRVLSADRGFGPATGQVWRRRSMVTRNSTLPPVRSLKGGASSPWAR